MSLWRGFFGYRPGASRNLQTAPGIYNGNGTPIGLGGPTDPGGNYSLFIYDGELLPEQQIEEIAAGDGDVIVLHHQELAALIDSNFTMLRAA